MEAYQGILDKIGTKGEFTRTAQEDEQLAQKREYLNDLTSQGMERKRQLEKEIDALRKNPMGQSQSAVDYNISEKTRLANQELADIAIQVQVAQGNVDTALTIIKDKVSAEFEPLEQQLSGIKDWMTFNNDDLTKSEQIMLQSRLSQQESSLKAQQEQAVAQQTATSLQTALEQGFITEDVFNAAVQKDASLLNYMNPTYKSKYTDEVISPLIEKSNTINSLMNNPALSSAVGPNPLARFGGMAGLTGAKGDFVLGVEQLISRETMDTLLALKKAGGTLGALSDGERFMLESAASSIGGARVKNDDGNVIGYKMTEGAFKNALLDLQKIADTALLKADITPIEKKKEILTNKVIREFPNESPQKQADRVNLLIPQYTSFNQVGNTSASKIAEAIKTVESGGNYNAKGPVVTSGQYKGERALGAYQIMPSNIPSWSKEALGYSVTPQQFMANPKIQDQIAQSRFSKLLQQYSPEDVASIWFSGRPLANNMSKDVTGTNVPTYVKNVMKNLS
jgi:predicted ABC-type ATPase